MKGYRRWATVGRVQGESKSTVHGAGSGKSSVVSSQGLSTKDEVTSH